VVKTSAIKSWSITPALPAGLTFDSSTGVISGTPTTNSPTSAYVVTGVSSAGQRYSANLSISVTSNILLNLGHVAPMQFIQFDTSHVLSEDVTGRWILWNYATVAQIAGGVAQLRGVDGDQNGIPAAMALAGPTVVIATVTGLELRSSATGAVAAEITAALKWWELATDGSYVCGGNSSQLQCWSPSGQLLFSEAGDYNYSIAHVFAAPSGLVVALDNGVIETVSSATWTSSVGPPFQGTFYAWFVDGSQFLTTDATSNTVYEYSLASVLEGSVSLPSLQGLVGQGNWIWTDQPTYGTDPYGNPEVISNAVTLYRVGSSATPVATLQLGPLLVPASTFIDSLSGSSLTVVDLSGATPVETSYSLPIAVPPPPNILLGPAPFVFVAFSPTHFMESAGSGFLVDGSVPGAPRNFDYGAIISIAGSTARAVFTTASGNAFSYNSATNALEDAAPLASAPLASDSQLALSSDGSVLAAIDTSGSVVVYSLPGWTLINTLPAPYSIVLSGSGTTLGEELANATAQSVPVTGGAATPDPSSCRQVFIYLCPIQVSPDGTLAAVASESLGAMDYELENIGEIYSPPTTAISRNGALLATVPGYPVAWLDDSRLLVNTYASCLDSTQACYTGATIYGPTGTKLAAPPIEEIDSLQVVSSDLVYSQQSNEVISLTSGTSTWMSQDPFGGGGACCPTEPQWGVFAGSAIVFVSGNLVVAQPY
jgi:hypothetical protein